MRATVMPSHVAPSGQLNLCPVVCRLSLVRANCVGWRVLAGTRCCGWSCCRGALFLRQPSGVRVCKLHFGYRGAPEQRSSFSSLETDGELKAGWEWCNRKPEAWLLTMMPLPWSLTRPTLNLKQAARQELSHCESAQRADWLAASVLDYPLGIL